MTKGYIVFGVSIFYSAIISALITEADVRVLMEEAFSKKDYLPKSHELLTIISTIFDQQCKPRAEPAYKKFLVPPREKPIVDYEGLNEQEIEKEAFLAGDIEQLKKLPQRTSIIEKINLLEKIASLDKQIDKLFKGLVEAKDYDKFIVVNKNKAIDLYNQLYLLMKNFIERNDLNQLGNYVLLSYNYVSGIHLDKELALIVLFRGNFEDFFPRQGRDSGFVQETQMWRLYYELDSLHLKKRSSFDAPEQQRIAWLYHMILALLPVLPRFMTSTFADSLDDILMHFLKLKVPKNLCKDSKKNGINECSKDYLEYYTAWGEKLPA
jgi:hypothetical protein